MNNPESNDFVANNELMDSLKMEYSSLDPGEQERITSIALDAREAVMLNYGKYLDPEVKKNFAKIESRVLVTDKKGYLQFYQDWTKKEEMEHIPDQARMFFTGNILCIQDMKEEAQEYWRINQEYFRNNHIDENSVEKYYQTVMITSSILHEFIHSAENYNLSNETDLGKVAVIKGLEECGTSFLNKNILTEYLKTIPDIEQNRSDFFNNLLTKYGENLLYVFFNHKPEDMDEKSFNHLKETVFNEFTPQTLEDLKII